ncbi:hypothetical protein [Phycicoccus sonneratiae]|uniref:Uncharacterized protein n=1 Tax=Phycicoccus sonneratiae TaxID=2807628 RepID=A0ABS2CR50_9MICO|nr:hypothetical protein [Phycicoccus sonneraticus]MBM6402365.1 hypothetical protein [Phycicoccus sonneraticus]
MTRIVGTALVHSEEARGWRVSTVEYPEGRAHIEHRSRLTQVLVGDRSGSMAAPGVPCYSTAACTPDGELLVAVRSAPPALVVTTDGCRVHPADGTGHDSVFPAAGERLILLSCNAYEVAPDLLAEEVRASPGRLALDAPEDLLLALLGPGGRGAGAVITHD